MLNFLQYCALLAGGMLKSRVTAQKVNVDGWMADKVDEHEFKKATAQLISAEMLSAGRLMGR